MIDDETMRNIDGACEEIHLAANRIVERRKLDKTGRLLALMMLVTDSVACENCPGCRHHQLTLIEKIFPGLLREAAGRPAASQSGHVH